MRPELQRFALGQGIIQAVYPKSWEVDILSDEGGIVQRVMVVGPRFPEVSPQVPGAVYTDRPQWAIYAHAAHLQGQPICWLVPSRLNSVEIERAQYVYWEEVLNFRISIDRDNNLEIRCRPLGSEDKYRIRVEETDGVIRLDTPRTRIVLKEADQSILVECDKRLTIHCKDATVNVDNQADVTVGANANLIVGGNLDAKVTGTTTLQTAALTVTAPTSIFSGNVNIGGVLNMT